MPTRGEHLRATAGSFLDTRFEPAQEARIAEQHERLQRPDAVRPPRLSGGHELAVRSPGPHRAKRFTRPCSTRGRSPQAERPGGPTADPLRTEN